jgi:hypothetical protein
MPFCVPRPQHSNTGHHDWSGDGVRDSSSHNSTELLGRDETESDLCCGTRVVVATKKQRRDFCHAKMRSKLAIW